MKRFISLLLIFSIVCATPVFCEPQRSLKTSGSGKNNTLQVSPESLGSYILNQNVQLMTRDGTYVKGKVLRASKDEITLKMKTVEPKNRISGQEATLRSADIAVVNMKKSGNGWAITLGILGGLFGMASIGAQVGSNSYYGAADRAMILGATGLGATGGALLGKRISRKTVVINVESSKNP